MLDIQNTFFMGLGFLASGIHSPHHLYHIVFNMFRGRLNPIKLQKESDDQKRNVWLRSEHFIFCFMYFAWDAKMHVVTRRLITIQGTTGQGYLLMLFWILDFALDIVSE